MRSGSRFASSARSAACASGNNVLVFVIFRSTSWLLAGAITVLVLVPLVWTMPHRMGVCLAFDD